ncbi:hypothetical protein LXL04_036518 [Taraxacum kok-saghyz]
MQERKIPVPRFIPDRKKANGYIATATSRFKLANPYDKDVCAPQIRVGIREVVDHPSVPFQKIAEKFGNHVAITESGRTEFDVGLGLSSDCPDRVRHQRLLPNTSDSGPSPTSEANFSVCDYIGRTESEAKGRTESVVQVRRTLSNAQTTDRVRGPSPSLWSETLANSP